jgi:hypothetical protein
MRVWGVIGGGFPGFSGHPKRLEKKLKQFAINDLQLKQLGFV